MTCRSLFVAPRGEFEVRGRLAAFLIVVRLLRMQSIDTRAVEGKGKSEIAEKRFAEVRR